MKHGCTKNYYYPARFDNTREPDIILASIAAFQCNVNCPDASRKMLGHPSLLSGLLHRFVIFMILKSHHPEVLHLLRIKR